jgi:hypothetical protein
MSPPSAAARRPSSRTVIACVMIVVLAAAAVLFQNKLRSKMRDFEVYHTAARRAAAAEPLYRAEDEHYQYKYFPAFAVALIPLGSVPLDTAKALWTALSLTSLAALLYASLRVLPDRRLPARVLVTLTVIALAKFYGHEVVLGQTNLLFALLLAGAIAALLHRRDAAAGVLAGLSVWVKPYALVFLPYLLVARRPGAALAMIGAVTAGLVLPVLRYGWSGNLSLLAAWRSTVTGTTGSTLTSQDNVSIFALAGKWLGDGAAASLLTTLILLAVGAAALLMLRWRAGARQPEYLDCGALMTVIPLLSPQGWDYVLLVATPFVMCLVNAMPVLPRGWQIAAGAALAASALSLYDVLGAALYRQFMALSLITVCYLVLLAVAVEIRRRRLA